MRRWFTALLAGFVIAAAACPAYASRPEADADPFILDEGGFPVPAAEFVAHMQWVFGACELAAGSTPLADDALVSTGQTLRVFDELDPSIVLAQAPVVVMGDVLGTGEASLSQLSRIAQAVAGTHPLEGIWADAADLDGSGAIGISDLVMAAQEYLAVSSALEARFSCEILPTIVSGTGGLELNIPLYFEGGQRDIPFVSTDTIFYVLSALLESRRGQLPVQMEANGSTFVYSRPDGTSATFDCEQDTVSFTNYDAFFQTPDAGSLLDAVSPWTDEKGEAILIERAPGSYGRAGQPVAVALGDYAIDIIEHGPKGYVPLQTFADLFLSPLSLQTLYNGEIVIVTEDGQAEELTGLYYAAPPRQRSAELIAYNYNEICLALDLMYGLREQHNITDFDSFFRQTGLRDDLMSPDGQTADRALSSLMDGYLGDGHSALLGPSFYAGQYADVESNLISPSVDMSILSELLFAEAREQAYPDGIPGYEEIGDTAFITFDEFTADPGQENLVPDEIPQDTMELIAYAHRRITRQDTPVRNVVVDLTCNGGGAVDAAVYVAGWLLGTVQLDQDSSLTGAQASTKYRCDVNLDGRFDDADTVTSFNRYCLISPASFSCGNLLPCALKGTDVTLLGQATGGGACIVQPLSTADGTMLQISGPVRSCTQSNGSYYEADRGISPDYYVAHLRDFYDREGLIDYIKSLA